MARSRRTGRATLLLPVLTLLLGAAALTAVYFYGASRPPQRSERTALPTPAEPITLWSEEAVFDSPVALPTVPEEDGESAPSGYGEILRQEDGVTVYRVHGKRYRGLLTVIDDPTRLFVGTLNAYGWRGMMLDEFVRTNDALLGINGGGFEDANGQGDGGTPTGVVMVDGSFRWGGVYGLYDVCAFDGNGRLYTGQRSGQELVDLGIQHAICYGPALIVDGEVQDFSAHYDYLEPRTAVGQREDGTTFLLLVEGRQVGALGVSLSQLADIMLSYGAVNATNLDGGASSVMIYEGEMLNHPNTLGGMRPLPSALLLRRSEKESAE